ncbi:MAG: aconitate hydratase AcnA [Candidatus Delongbacteria bacterium]|nr:aconitate hydratase AcnA [Candidatus Delongbacteria bacterium]
MQKLNTLGARDTFETGSGPAYIYRLDALERAGMGQVSRLPYSIRILLESVLRNCDGYVIREEDVRRLAGWNPARPEAAEIPYRPARVILQDFTGVPCVVDLAAMRSAMQRMGGDPNRINPIVPVDLVIDHSIQVDHFGNAGALAANTTIEFERNLERYSFLRWGQQAFANFQVVPPAVGIVHQVNLEYLAKGVLERPESGGTVIFPDSCVGTDSHTTMINGLGIAGWGVGGIEAEAVMLGQPIYMLIPEVVGFRFTGIPREGVTATDITLWAVQMLRRKGVVGKFVEYFGDGLDHLSLPDRATLANMAPEYGATMGFFPMDAGTLRYLRQSGREEKLVQCVERYMKEQNLFRMEGSIDPVYTDTLELDLSSVEPSLAGPKRPQDRVSLHHVAQEFRKSLSAPAGTQGFGLDGARLEARAAVSGGKDLTHGDVVLAAITSCTNTSNPGVLLAAGLLAKKAVEAGLKVSSHVKTSLAPGSRVVTDYLGKTGLLPYLEKLGFNVVGYGCTTCIGNSGPLPDAIESALAGSDVVVAGVLSGNRNFEGRIHARIKANYLASPPLVVAYALAGSVSLDLATEPLGIGSDGRGVFLKDIWPSNKEIDELLGQAMDPETYRRIYSGVGASNADWNAIPVSGGDLYDWNPDSTYIQEPDFFDMPRETSPIGSIENARTLAWLGDSVTTDHISPAGAIPEEMPAGRFLKAAGVTKKDFNSFGARRGNDRVMTRGTFGNIRLRNLLAPGTEGGWTRHFPDGEVIPIYDASLKYKESGTPLVIFAGKEYGTGSSRDWAAKGTFLLGVRAVIAESFERIHRSNLVGMGVLPLQFLDGQSMASLGFDGTEIFTIPLTDQLKAGQKVTVKWVCAEGKGSGEFETLCRIDTPVEVDYYRNGGILQTVLRNFLAE